MTDYAVGDIQGCYDELCELIEQVAFDPACDRLWVVGDMINRGPGSRDTLAFLYEHRHSVVAVLGNHDLHLLAIYYGYRKVKRSDTVTDILESPDIEQWVGWLRSLPLCHYEADTDWLMVHAGLAPQWTVADALARSREIEQLLQGDDIEHFLSTMYGDEPERWNDALEGPARWRCITNHFTRMRIIADDGRLDLAYKSNLEDIPAGYQPWFEHPERQTRQQRIVFGHWAAIGGRFEHPVYAIDTACVWGERLSLLQLDNLQTFSVEAH